MELLTKMPRALAIQLLHENADDIGTCAFALVRTLRPTFELLDADLAAASASATMRVIARFLETKDESLLVDHFRALIQLRRDAGFNAIDFVVMSHCYLPSIRHLCVARAPSAQQGLAAYEVVESVVLPTLERLMQIGLSEIPDHTQPDGAPVSQTAAVLQPVVVRDVLTRALSPTASPSIQAGSPAIHEATKGARE